MPFVLDEIDLSDSVKAHGLRHANVKIQKILPSADDGDKFPTQLRDKPIGVLSVYHKEPNIDPFHLNAKQLLECLQSPEGKTIDVYGPTHLYDVKLSEVKPPELHIMHYVKGRMLSIAHFDLCDLNKCIVFAYAKNPELLI